MGVGVPKVSQPNNQDQGLQFHDRESFDFLDREVPLLVKVANIAPPAPVKRWRDLEASVMGMSRGSYFQVR